MRWPNSAETHVLRAFSRLGREREVYGLEMVKISDGKLNRGLIYVTLGRMEEIGMLHSRQEDLTPEYIGIPRRLYSLTVYGVKLKDIVEFYDRHHDAGGGHYIQWPGTQRA